MNFVLLISFLWCYSYVNCISYTIESQTFDGKHCLTDCVNGKCWISYREEGFCTPGWKRAATYYTSLYKSDKRTCVSRCASASYDYSWCYVDDDFNWDYCNPDTKATNKWYQYSKENGRCKDNCTKRDGTSYLWCHTYWGSWDYCDETSYYEDQAKTVYGKDCYGNCYPHDGSYYWCYDADKSENKCAPSAVRYECPSVRRPRSPDRPTATVEEYNREIDTDVRNNVLTTTTISSLNNPDVNNPVLDYTYRTTANGLRLPVRIRARIRPAPYHHLRGTNTRRSSDISYNARRNCNAMGMHVCLSNLNSDHLGHLVPYILGGPPDWYNIVPQTRRINVGTTTNTNLISPSIWRVTERGMQRWVQGGGSVYYQVLVSYDLPSTRPTGFGVIEEYFDANGAPVPHLQCPGYWYSNDPNEDPDIWNHD